LPEKPEHLSVRKPHTPACIVKAIASNRWFVLCLSIAQCLQLSNRRCWIFPLALVGEFIGEFMAGGLPAQTILWDAMDYYKINLWKLLLALIDM